MRRPWSLQTYAYLLLLAVTVPLVLVLLAAEYRQIRTLDEETGRQVLALARIAAADAERWFVETREALDRIARRPAVRALDKSACGPVGDDSAGIPARWTALWLTGGKGQVVCYAGIAAPSGDPRDANAAAGRRIDSAQGDWVAAVPTGSAERPSSLLLAVPVRAPEAAPVGALVARVDAARFLPARQWGGGLLPGSTAVFLDRNGRIVARGDAGSTSVVALPGEAMAEILHVRDGHRRGRTVDGADVHYGFADIPEAQGTMLVAIPAAAADPAVLAALRHNPLRALAMLGVAVLAVTLVTRYFAQPLREVAAVARRVAAGDRAVRAREGGPLELVELARQTNRLQDDLVRSGEALHASEARFRALADLAPALIWMVDANQRCTYVNQAWTAFTGRPPEQDLGDGWLDRVHPDDRARCRDANAAAFAARRGFAVEFRLRRGDGEYRWVLNQGVPRFADGGTLAGYVSSGVDIHDRVVADQRVRRLTTLYAALSEVNEAILRLQNPAALFQRVCDIVVRHGLAVANIGMLDPDRRFLRFVAVAGDRWNLFRGTVIATDGSDPRHAIPTMIALRDEAPFVSNDRSTDTRTVPLRDPVVARELRATAAFPLRQQGRVVGVFDVSADEVDFFDAELVRLLELLADDVSFALETLAALAHREAAEAALRQLNATLEERVRERTRSLEMANRELEAFSYSTSHDLRAPLRAIGGFTDIVLERHAGSLDAEALGYLRRVRSAATRMSHLIDDLLDLSRISRAAFERHATSLTDLAQEIVAELAEGSAGRDVDVRIAPGMVAQVDPGLVRLLLANLLGNAWKFTGRIQHATIEFGTLEREGRETYFVRDNGAGFDMEHADKLFAPFQRLHGEREFPGTGIGLALAQRVVNRHGGRIWAEAATDLGATFFFTLQP